MSSLVGLTFRLLMHRGLIEELVTNLVFPQVLTLVYCKVQIWGPTVIRSPEEQVNMPHFAFTWSVGMALKS